ncbi:glycosyltransferase [Acidobacteria bacterium AH-259-A15]|nr:glycosyltransferase [Acidobacteria bacterium AH-259-A15]
MTGLVNPMAHKVLFIHYGGGVGGAPVSMLQLAAALDRDRFEPLVVFTQEGPVLEFARQLGVSAQVVPMRSAFFYSTHVPIRLRSLWSFLRYYRRTVKMAENLVEKVKPDLVHLNTSVLVPAAVGTKQTGTPIVWHVREPAGPNPVLRRGTSTGSNRYLIISSPTPSTLL